MRRNLWRAVLFFILFAGVSGLFCIKNPLTSWVMEEVKARGILPYTADEAVALAYRRCAGCHDDDKITKYCARCGPPFVVVTHFMKKYVEVSRSQGSAIAQFTDAELVAIVQVWNGLVGNWEADWRQQDLQKLIEENKVLTDLLATPVEKRKIEAALQGKHAPGSYKEVKEIQ